MIKTKIAMLVVATMATVIIIPIKIKPAIMAILTVVNNGKVALN